MTHKTCPKGHRSLFRACPYCRPTTRKKAQEARRLAIRDIAKQVEGTQKYLRVKTGARRKAA